MLSIPRLGGEPRQELNLSHLAGLSGFNIRLLPGGDWLLYESENQVYLGDDPAALEARGKRLAGEGVFSIPGLEELYVALPSPDGGLLAFMGSAEGGGPAAGLLSTASRGSPRIVEAWGGAIPMGWSDDGRRLYLWRGTGRDTGDLLRQEIDPATGEPSGQPVLVAPRLSARGISVSGDGRRLALVSGNRVQNLMEFSLDETADASDNPTRRRSRGTGRWYVQDFLPSGELLATLNLDRGTELFVIDGNGSRRSVQRLSEPDHSMAVSPDGTTVAITLAAPSVLLLDIESGRTRRIEVPEILSGVAWSPDGARLAAMTSRSADRMVTLDLASSTATTVELDCGDTCEFAAESIAAGPEWPYMAITSRGRYLGRQRRNGSAAPGRRRHVVRRAMARRLDLLRPLRRPDRPAGLRAVPRVGRRRDRGAAARSAHRVQQLPHGTGRSQRGVRPGRVPAGRARHRRVGDVTVNDIERKLIAYSSKPARAVRPMLQSRSFDSSSVIEVV